MPNYYAVAAKITKFIREETRGNGKGAIIGISGGLDSAVVAALAQRAIGSDVKALLLPYGNQSYEDGKGIAEQLGVSYKIINIKPLVDTVENDIERYFDLKLDMNNPFHRLVKGNLMARARMVYLYLSANLENQMVLGTTNKSEYEIGYATKGGDGLADLEPLQDIYKTELFELAHYIPLPNWVVEKKPSAELWPGQTDEGEIGCPYKILDSVLKGEGGIDANLVRMINEKVLCATHKKNPPKYPKLRHLLVN